MALKTKLTKSEFDALAEALKEHYKEVNGVYLLDSDDAAELRRAKERSDEEARIAKEERDRLKAEKDAADAAARTAEEARVRASGDIAAIEASWQAKLDAATAQGASATAALNTQISALVIKANADKIAAEISTVPDLLAPIIAARLQVDTSGDVPFARVLGTDGKPSALSLAELSQEFVANPKYAAIIIGSKANGGGAGDKTPSGSGGPKKISEMTETEKVAFYKEVGEAEYNRRLAAERDAK